MSSTTRVDERLVDMAIAEAKHLQTSNRKRNTLISRKKGEPKNVLNFKRLAFRANGTDHVTFGLFLWSRDPEAAKLKVYMIELVPAPDVVLSIDWQRGYLDIIRNMFIIKTTKTSQDQDEIEKNKRLHGHYAEIRVRREYANTVTTFLKSDPINFNILSGNFIVSHRTNPIV